MTIPYWMAIQCVDGAYHGRERELRRAVRAAPTERPMQVAEVGDTDYSSLPWQHNTAEVMQWTWDFEANMRS